MNWISVKNRLPEQWVDVLTYREDGQMYVDQFDGIRFEDEAPCWVGDGWLLTGTNDYDGRVLYWQPLPSVPEGARQ